MCYNDNMRIYVMRHGTTCWNEQGIVQGRSNNRLSKKGVQEVINVAKEHKNTPIDMIFCSPLMRTRQTAKLMNEWHKVKVVFDERLTEIDKGIFTARKKKDFLPEEEYQKKILDPECKMETAEQVMDRTVDFYEDLIANCDKKNVLIVTHAGIACRLESLILKKEFVHLDKKDRKNYKNAEIRQFFVEK